MSKKWSAELCIPTDSNYKSRILKAEFKNSKSSGNPMIEVVWELVEPQSVQVGEHEVNIAGVECRKYYTISKKDDETGKVIDVQGKEQLTFLFNQVGVTDIDWENPPVQYLLGKCFLTCVECKVEPRRATPTAAQVEAGKKANKKPEGTIMNNPLTGLPMVNYWPEVKEVFGLSPDGHVGMAF